MNGLLIVNKPVGPTSHDVVFRVRKWSGERRVGHSGTLDPLAGGVLILCLGSATRISEYLLGWDKKYRATVRFGQATDTYDAQGAVLAQRPADLSLEQVERALTQFRGPISQVPPAYSAVQVGGRRAYDLARSGEMPDIQPRTVQIHALTIESWASPDVTLDVHCSAGTYIRSLAHDLGRALGCGGHLVALTRTAAGRITLAEAHALPAIETAFRSGRGAQILRPTDWALGDWPAIHLDAADARRIMHGNPVPLTEPASGLGRAYGPDGTLIAVVEADPKAMEWKPKKVLTPA